jgi:hypothetical protein
MEGDGEVQTDRAVPLSQAEILVVTEAIGRAHHAGWRPAEWHRRAMNTLRALRPRVAAGPLALNAALIVLDYVQRMS